MKGALPYPKYGLEKLILPGVMFYQSREDFERATGQESPPFNPDLEPKRWTDMRSNLPAYVPYNIAVVQAGGRLAIQPVSFGRGFALRLNIPIGKGGPGEDQPEVPFPIRDLFEDEELAYTPFGIEVHNRDLWAKLVGAGGAVDLTPVIERLDRVLRALGVPI